MQSDFRETEEGYRLLFESNPQPMWIYDRDNLFFLAVNNAAVHGYGYSLDEFLAMTIKNSTSSRHLKKDGTLITIM